MPNPKLALYAALLELGAWSGALLQNHDSDAALFCYLLLHGASSALLAFVAIALLPAGSARPRLPTLLLLAGCSYAVPILGFISILGGIVFLRLYRGKPAKEDFESIQLPEFDPHQRPSTGFRQAGLRSFLSNSDAPLQSRLGAMVALQYVSGHLSSPLLRDVLSDPSEDIRLLAYGLLDNLEKRISQAITEELKVFAEAVRDEGSTTPGPRTLAAAQRLSDHYWELVYQELAQGDLRQHAIGESARYCRMALQIEPDNAALNLRLGRLLHELGDDAGATEHYGRAHRLGLPATRILPYLAELRFAAGDFAEVRRLMAELANWGSLPRLRPVIDYWNPK